MYFNRYLFGLCGNIILSSLLTQNSTSFSDKSELEALKKECELAKKKCKDAQEKYFSESDRLKAIIDEMQGNVNELNATILASVLKCRLLKSNLE